MDDWSARLYLRFEAERTRPGGRSACSRFERSEPNASQTFGCGPGNSTELLARRFQGADILGLDTSDDMLAQARARLPGARFEKADVVQWRSAAPLDVIFANAALRRDSPAIST